MGWLALRIPVEPCKADDEASLPVGILVGRIERPDVEAVAFVEDVSDDEGPVEVI